MRFAARACRKPRAHDISRVRGIANVRQHARMCATRARGITRDAWHRECTRHHGSLHLWPHAGRRGTADRALSHASHAASTRQRQRHRHASLAASTSEPLVYDGSGYVGSCLASQCIAGFQHRSASCLRGFDPMRAPCPCRLRAHDCCLDPAALGGPTRQALASAPVCVHVQPREGSSVERSTPEACDGPTCGPPIHRERPKAHWEPPATRPSRAYRRGVAPSREIR